MVHKVNEFELFVAFYEEANRLRLILHIFALIATAIQARVISDRKWSERNHNHRGYCQ